MADIKDLDLYSLLELTIEATEQEIRTAYRKKALKCHPDKNPDDKKAAETFHLLSKAIEVLLDQSARKAYDAVIRRKEEVKIRHSKLDSTRKKFKEDLERREREAENERHKGYKVNKTEEEIFQAEVDRLRTEGSIKLQEEIRLMMEELHATREFNETQAKENPENFRLRIKWKPQVETKPNEEYTQDSLNKIFSKYGSISVLVISAKKPGSALLEFELADSARRAKLYEMGFPGNSLKLSYLNPDTERSEARKQVSTESQFNTWNNVKANTGRPNESDSNKPCFPSFNTGSSTCFPSLSSNNSNTTPSANIFPSFVQSNSSTSQRKSSLFPGASESSNIYSPSSNSFSVPSGLFPSSLSFNVHNKMSSSKKSSQDLNYEEEVLSQMRKAQEKNT